MIFNCSMLRVTSRLYKSRGISLETLNNLSLTQLKRAYSSIIRKYTIQHEWVQVDNEIATIGITNHAQEALGDVVFAQLPEPNTELKALDECGAVESVKAASEIYSPVSGVVVEKNKAVEDNPGLINSSCYEKGWLYKLKLINLTELTGLMSENEYEEFLRTDSKIRDQ